MLPPSDRNRHTTRSKRKCPRRKERETTSGKSEKQVSGEVKPGKSVTLKSAGKYVVNGESAKAGLRTICWKETLGMNVE